MTKARAAASSIVVGSISSNIGLLYRAGVYCTSPDFLRGY
jgi:hypothetical protein